MPKVEFIHPEWSYKDVMVYIAENKCAEEGNNHVPHMPINTEGVWIDVRPDAAADDIDKDATAVVGDGETIYVQRLAVPAEAPVDAVQARAADQNNLAVQYEPAKKGKPGLPVRRGWPQIHCGRPLKFQGSPKIDQEDALYAYEDFRTKSDLDIVQSIINFAPYANIHGYTPALCRRFLRNLCVT